MVHHFFNRLALALSPTALCYVEGRMGSGIRHGEKGRIHLQAWREVALEPPEAPSAGFKAGFSTDAVRAWFSGPVIDGLREIARAYPPRGRSLHLALPAGLCRLASLHFERLPQRRMEAEKLIRWQMREFLPEPPDTYEVSYQTVPFRHGLPAGQAGESARNRKAGPYTVLAAMVPKSVLEALFSGVREGGWRPASVGLSPLLAFNLYHDRLFASTMSAGTVTRPTKNPTGIASCRAAHRACPIPTKPGAVVFCYLGGWEITALVLDEASRIRTARSRHARDGEQALEGLHRAVLLDQQEYGSKPYDRLILAGEHGPVQELAERLRGEKDIPVQILEPGEVVTPRKGLNVPDQNQQAGLAAALGAVT